MMVERKTAVVHGAGGAVGAAVARAFAEAGARVHLAGRTRARLERVADAIGGAAGVAEVDAFDEAAVAAHADAVARADGGIDVVVNAVAVPFVHDRPFLELSADEVLRPVDAHLRTNLVTTRSAAPHLAARGGTVLVLSAAASRLAMPGALGYGTACAALEALSQRLAAELGPSGVRVACIRAHLLADGPAQGASTADLVARRAAAAGVDADGWVARAQADVTLLGRLPTLADVAATATFLASDAAASITGAVVDVTGGNALRTRSGALAGVVR